MSTTDRDQALPMGLRERVMAASLLARGMGQPVPAVPEISADEAFARAADAFYELLRALSEQGWKTEALRGLDVQGLVGHLTGVEHDTHRALAGDPTVADAEHVESTQGSAVRQADRSPAQTLHEWRLAADHTLELIRGAGADPAAGGDTDRIAVHGIRLPLDDLLVVRAFELWVHDNDIRRADAGAGLRFPVRASWHVGHRAWVPADYQKIREENIARYGWDTAVLDLLGQLYSERTHFIFELIQNAEDAGATELAFEMFSDRLELRHDGRPFTEADVRGVCGVGKSAKSGDGDLTAIGKFGIGFKSVYAYTRSPRIYSGDEHFGIENYVRPFPLEPLAPPSAGTLFVFPFDHDTVPAAVAAREISTALTAVQPRILLFLRSIGRLRVGGTGVRGSVIERSVSALPAAGGP